MNEIKHFTPDEAKKTLPLVRRIVIDIINSGEMMRELAVRTKGDVTENSDIQALAQKINTYMQELQEIGCFYKDWNFTIGLVDFPSMIEGKEVMLCWRSDEEDIKYYHEPDAGYAGRRLIPEEYFMLKVGS